MIFFFSILVDESHDTSGKEKMTTIMCFVDKKYEIVEYFLGIFYVPDTTTSNLKIITEQLISPYDLSN